MSTPDKTKVPVPEAFMATDPAMEQVRPFPPEETTKEAFSISADIQELVGRIRERASRALVIDGEEVTGFSFKLRGGKTIETVAVTYFDAANEEKTKTFTTDEFLALP